MDASEVGKLLGLMALADNRKLPEDDAGRKAMIAFWLSMIGDLSFADAARAVREHYQQSREWIMPADIRARVRRYVHERFERNPVPAPPPELLDDPAAYNGHLRRTAQAIASGQPEHAAIEGARHE